MEFLFKNIVGNEETKTELIRLVNEGRFPHTSLFLGPPGSSKLALALASAQLLQCTVANDQGACGICNSCMKVTKMIHPDVHYTFPTIGSKVTSDEFITHWKENIPNNPYLSVFDWSNMLESGSKQMNINKDGCELILRKLALKSFEGNKKIMIIWMPEFLGTEGNRLLKIFEEPPENTYFILIAEQLDKLLPTIISRCQLFRIKPFEHEEIANLLELNGVDSEKSRQIAIGAEGDFNEALKRVDYKDLGHNERFMDWIRISYQGNAVKMTKFAEEFSKMKIEQQKYFLKTAMVMMRQALRTRIKVSISSILNEDETTFINKFSAVNTFDRIEGIISLLNDTVFYLERNANAKILIMSQSIRLNSLLSIK